MYITKELLRKKGACKEGIEWFENQFPEGAELNEENIAKIAECNSEFAWWLYNNVVQSKLLYGLCGVVDSEGVVDSKGIVDSEGIVDSKGINRSKSVVDSKSVANSMGVVDSSDVDWADGVANSMGINWANGVVNSRGINRAMGVANSFGIYRCVGIVNALFCANKLPEYSVFGALVERERFEEIQKELFEKLGNWKPVFYVKKDNRRITLTNQEAWSGMPKEAIQYVKSLPEYDAEMFYTITGIL